MKDDLRRPANKPTDESEAYKEEDKKVEETDEQISDDPVVEEEGTIYDPATQAPPEAER